MSLILPPHVVAQRHAEENKRFAADIFRNVTVEDDRAREFTGKLKQVHPDLWMVRAHETVDADLPLRPGFYHVLKVNDPAVAPVSVFCVHENGAWCEPDSRVFDRLAAGNLTQRRVRDAIEHQDRAVQEAIDRENQTRNEARREQLKEVVNSAVRAQVSMDRTIPWTQSSNGRRPR